MALKFNNLFPLALKACSTVESSLESPEKYPHMYKKNVLWSHGGV